MVDLGEVGFRMFDVCGRISAMDTDDITKLIFAQKSIGEYGTLGKEKREELEQRMLESMHTIAETISYQPETFIILFDVLLDRYADICKKVNVVMGTKEVE